MVRPFIAVLLVLCLSRASHAVPSPARPNIHLATSWHLFRRPLVPLHSILRPSVVASDQADSVSLPSLSRATSNDTTEDSGSDSSVTSEDETDTESTSAEGEPVKPTSKPTSTVDGPAKAPNEDSEEDSEEDPKDSPTSKPRTTPKKPAEPSSSSSRDSNGPAAKGDEPSRKKKSTKKPFSPLLILGITVGVIFGAAVPVILCCFCGCVSCAQPSPEQEVGDDTDELSSSKGTSSRRESSMSGRSKLDCRRNDLMWSEPLEESFMDCSDEESSSRGSSS